MIISVIFLFPNRATPSHSRQPNKLQCIGTLYKVYGNVLVCIQTLSRRIGTHETGYMVPRKKEHVLNDN